MLHHIPCFSSTFNSFFWPFDSLPSFFSFNFLCSCIVWKYIWLYDLLQPSLCWLLRSASEFDQTPIGTLRQTPISKECSLANLGYTFPPVLPGAVGELLFEFDQTGINFQILRFCTISGFPKLFSKILSRAERLLVKLDIRRCLNIHATFRLLNINKLSTLFQASLALIYAFS